jgi:hypothetical protein
MMWKSKKYKVEISNRFPAFENLNNDDVDITRVWESIRKDIKASAT